MKLPIPYRIFLFFVLLAQTITTMAQVNNLNHIGNGPYTSITLAISNSATVDGDTLTIAAGNYNEGVVVNKSLTIRGVDTTAVISCGTGTGIQITANNVAIQSIKISNCSISGMTASGVSNLQLLNVVSYANSMYGIQLTNIGGLLVTGGNYSCNGNDGFYSTGGSNYTMTDVTANWNRAGSEASGFFLSNLKGTTTLTNITANHNKTHGLDIRSGSMNVTLNGGNFEYNGSSSLSDGGGISIFTASTTVSNIALNGPIISSNNITCGIYVDAHTNSTDSVKGLTIGQSGGTVSFSSNGTTKGAGVILWGNVSDVSVTATFFKGAISESAGIMIVGQGSFGANSPKNVTIVNSVFQAGYTNLAPAISLSDAQTSPSNICINDVTATDNTFLGASGYSAIDDSLIYDKLNNSSLGRVNQNGSKLPVELTTIQASVDIHTAVLKWSTATEADNYGFEVERRAINLQSITNSQQLKANSQEPKANIWNKIGFVPGNGTSNSSHTYSYSDADLLSGRYAYRLKQIDNNGAFKYSQEVEVEIAVPEISGLLQNFPNPFNPQTNISFQLSAVSNVTLKIYDVLGREAAVLVDGIQEAGYHSVAFSASSRNGSIFSSGIYLARLFAQPIDGGRCFEQSRKMLFAK
jgi:hypothetical protein